MCPKQGLEPCQKHIQAQRERQSCILLARGGVGTLAASTKGPEDREFAVDSGASIHMVSKNDLDSAELEIMRTSRNPTTVMTANGKVQTREEGTENVAELELLVTVLLLEATHAVLSLWKLYHWTSGQKPQLTKKGKRIDCNVSNYEFLYNANTNFIIIFITGFRI